MAIDFIIFLWLLRGVITRSKRNAGEFSNHYIHPIFAANSLSHPENFGSFLFFSAI
jgi:hypothetical protein